MTAPRLLIATKNPGKLTEFQTILSGHFKCDTLPASYVEPPENGATYFEHALLKAVRAQAAFRKPVLADDSGLEVDALQGDPGVHSAYYGGKQLSWPERWNVLHGELAPIPESQWTARFRAVLCYYDGEKPPVFFEGTVEGLVVPKPVGGNGFGYDPIFFCPEIGKTMAEAESDEKHRVSHRGRAARHFINWWQAVRANLTAPATPSSFT